MNQIHILKGTEGPRHDPYSYTEMTVNTQRGVVKMHEGLAVWCEWRVPNGECYRREEEEAIRLFTWIVGVTPRAAETAYHAAKQRRVSRHLCACRSHAEWQSGFPGEELLCCHRCGEVLDATFNKSAII